MNIFLNSFKAMPDGGTIIIRIRTEKEPEVTQSENRRISIDNPFTVARPWLVIAIRDEGCGIPDEQLNKIMEPFVSFRDDGIGLGLSIISQLVGLHHGHIRIDSTEGAGTTFHLYFPCKLGETGKQ
jgi:signal transduction histidine kinase